MTRVNDSPNTAINPFRAIICTTHINTKKDNCMGQTNVACRKPVSLYLNPALDQSPPSPASMVRYKELRIVCLKASIVSSDKEIGVQGNQIHQHYLYTGVHL